MARALWLESPGEARHREATVEPTATDVVVETEYSGISRGTESLVAKGAVPGSEHDRMRCPFQEGDFPFPVKYGYAAVGVVSAGPPDLEGRRVFCLHPHQDRFAAPVDMVVPVPDHVPAGRAVLAANMETALNIVWDAGILPGDRVSVVGAGVVGALVAYLAAGIAGTEVAVVDVNPQRRPVVESFGARMAEDDAGKDFDVVIHTSASDAGLATAIASAGREARVVEASWYGDRNAQVPLGGAFHALRLSIVSSQVGSIPPARRARWTFRRRMETAIRLLDDDRLDILISGETAFDDLPGRYHAILADPSTLCHRIRYRP